MKPFLILFLNFVAPCWKSSSDPETTTTTTFSTTKTSTSTMITTTTTTGTTSTILTARPISDDIIKFRKSDICFQFNDTTATVDYTGLDNQTRHGKDCQIWEGTKYSSGERNYCRSPDHDQAGVWCYCKNPDDCENGWDYCNVPDCNGPLFKECFPGKSGYNGTVSHTISGIPCQPWLENFPNEVHVYPEFDRQSQNYCSEAGGLTKAWCYKGLYYDPEASWEYCDITYNCHDDEEENDIY